MADGARSKRLWAPVLFWLAASCGGGDEPAGNRTASAPADKASSQDAAAPAADSLAGLYEGGAGAQKSQMCIVEKGREAQFGLLVWGGNLHSCSGAGRAIREGERLTLKMTGDETCAIPATLKDGRVTLPATVPAGCAYYCGARASFAGASFTRTGTSAADVKKARDIAGDPLCD